MEDKRNQLLNLPYELRERILTHRHTRAAGLQELVRRQNAEFLDSVEAEMWNLLGLPGKTQPGFIVLIVATALSKEVRKQARINVLEANRLAVEAYKHFTVMKEELIEDMYWMSVCPEETSE